ncbi:methyl-accepting chemotaxis protein [Temperatibacter marinus]|uniref:Methyl-accepting chemotaxis protein n=1 Tax=Temperatibacter marinus TaxID=1456591 RepID=A0AA52HA94_9PROT|nr:methyl-accepting chemotaxis protein [Temperatibacter marinus]WND04011.1 methyl-accepting chemotaxis protein [Temperatibacter marinus]
MTEDLAKVEAALDNLINGNFTASEGDCSGDSPLLAKVNILADKSVSRSEENLKRTVDYSIIANKGMASIARMSRYITDVNGQSQSIASAIEELSSSVKSISSSAEQASMEVDQVATSAATGIIAADNAQKSMEEIAGAVHTAGERVTELSKTSEEIGKIVKDIEDIAKQTNLLALNATIEAARAGDAGKGFAVVASEVKNLANQTASATDTIRSRIEALRTEMSAIVGTMEDGETKVSEGRTVIEQSTAEMHGISRQVDSVNAHMSEINTILEQQVSATSEVSNGAAIIVERSQQNSDSIKQVIDQLNETETPIAESINYFVEKSGLSATLYAAKSDHMIWMRKLSQMLAGSIVLKANELSDHHQCRLGKWYDTQTNPALTSLPEWRQLEAPHKQVHQAGIEASKAYASGDISAAIAAIQKADDASKQVMILLDQIISKF